jgi:methyl-accepting chemotaxis protein
MGIAKETKTEQNKSTEPTGPSNSEHTGDLSAGAASPNQVDQVREILFGAQRDEYDRRFNRLEELIVKSISDLNNELTEKLGNLRDEYDKRFSRIEELLTRSITDLSNDTLAKVNNLRDDTDRNLAHIEQLIDTINNDTQNHLDKKIDKTALSKLLSELQELSHSLDVARKD